MAGVKRLIKMEACTDCVKWTARQPSLEVAWQNCERGDWMLWRLGMLSGPPESDSRRKLVLASCKCARLSLPYVPDGEERPRILIETAERWAKGENTDIEKLKHAAYETYAASADYTAVAASAADAACAAADAASAASADYTAVAACAAVCSAAYAAYASYAASAAVAAVAADARKRVLRECAEIVREFYPHYPTRAKG